MYAKFTQLKAEVILTIQVLRRYWFGNLVGFFVDLVYFYAIFVAVRSLVPGENLPGTSSLILMYTVLHLTLGFYTSFYRFLRNDALQGTLEHLALARGGLLSQLFVRLAVQGAYIILQSLLRGCRKSPPRAVTRPWPAASPTIVACPDRPRPRLPEGSPHSPWQDAGSAPAKQRSFPPPTS
jgi:hypothetical protein